MLTYQPYLNCGMACVLCTKSRSRRGLRLPRFILLVSFSVTLLLRFRLPFVAAFSVLEGLIIYVLYLCLAAPVATMGLFSPGDSPFQVVGELVGCVQVPVGTVGPFSLCDSPFRAVGWGRGGGLVGCVQNRGIGACGPRLSRFILVVSFSNNWIVVWILV